MKSNFPRLVVTPSVGSEMVEIAREFRKEPTEREKMLWEALRGNKLDGIKFRRQQPIGYFVVDFHASRFRLIIEVDGPIHDQQLEADKARQDILEVLGLTVLRIRTETVQKSLPSALTVIRAKIQEIKQNPMPNVPSPRVGES